MSKVGSRYAVFLVLVVRAHLMCSCYWLIHLMCSSIDLLVLLYVRLCCYTGFYVVSQHFSLYKFSASTAFIVHNTVRSYKHYGCSVSSVRFSVDCNIIL